MRSMTPNDVLNDIEFELMQGSIARDEVGQGIQATRQFQNKIRAETLQLVTDQKIDNAELVGRQFQVNDMVLSLFQAIEAKLQALQAELRRAAYLKQHELNAPPDVDDGADPHIMTLGSPGETYPKQIHPQHVGWQPDYVGLEEMSDNDMTDAMKDNALDVPLDIRPVRVPLVGWFFTRLRASFHILTLFYVGQLARKQTSINRTYGEHILRLEQVNQHQQAQIEMLAGQLADLQKRFDG